MTEKDMVNSPPHYAESKIECIDAIEASMSTEAFKGMCKGNALKYLWRTGKKDPKKEVEDLKKAIWYINRYIKTVEENETIP